MDTDFSTKFVLEDDDSDKENSPQATISHRTPQLPVAPSFKACSNANASLPLPQTRKSCSQTESNVDFAAINQTLPGNAVISAFNQILSTNPSSKQLSALLNSQRSLKAVFSVLANCAWRIN